MKITLRPLTLLAVCLLFLFTLSYTARSQDKDWRPVTPAELSSSKPIVEADADAEAIFWEIRIDDSSSEDLSLKHYVRIKIYTERGREKYSKLDVPFLKGTKIKDMMARVIKPDGSIVEIKKDDIFEREIVKVSGLKVKAKSFAVPNIEPGVIIEYRYKEVTSDAGASGMRLQFQRELPIQKIAYYYKPYNKNEPLYQSYNFTDTKFVKDKDGFWLAMRTDVPAMKEEPRMPPDDMVQAWMRLTAARFNVLSASDFNITFSFKDPSSPTRYWAAVTQENGPLVAIMTKSNDDIKKASADITAGAATADEKLKKIYDFCQTQIANTSFDPALTDEQRAKLPKTKSLSDVLKRKSASSQYVDLLFGALANAAGFETRIAFSGNRSKMFINPDMANENFVHPAAIAVKVGEAWKYFNPGMRFLPYGMLVWYEEDTWAILISEKRYDWRKTPFTPYQASQTKRTGKFNLLEDGTLEGDVVIELSGQPGLLYRIDNFDEAPAKWEENLKNEIKEQMSTAEVSGIVIENVTDATKPVVQRYKIRVPNYAQKTGKRLFVQPSVFEYGVNPIFSASTRKYDIFFQYPWSELDHVEITLPKTYDLDNADSPGRLADPSQIGVLDITMKIDRPQNVLKYDRNFHFGGDGHVLFDASLYKPLKDLFDAFQKSDSHTIVLKQR